MFSIRRIQAEPNDARAMFKPPRWEWSQRGNVGWWTLGHWRDTLLGPAGLRLDQWQAEGRLTTIKAGPHRIVYRVDLPDGPIYVKHFLIPDFRAMFRQWFRRGKGRNEGKRSYELSSIGIPTITPIALGEQRKRRFLFENFLVTPEIGGARPLDDFLENCLDLWPEPRRSLLRRRLAIGLAELTARLHESNLVHIDYHPGNVLMRLDHEDNPELLMIDLDALRKVKRLSWGEAERNLALLNHYFWPRSSRTDRHRFLVSYLRLRTSPTPESGRFARGIEESTRSWAERLWRRGGRRCRFNNKYFEVTRARNGWVAASRELDRDEVIAMIADPDAVFLRPGTKILKDSRTTTVAETRMSVRGRSTNVIFKRFNRKKLLDPLLTLFRPSRAWRSWQAGQHLSIRGVPTPQNLAIFLKTRPSRLGLLRGFLPREFYLVTLKEEESVTLEEYLREVLPQFKEPERRASLRQLTLSLARLIRKLHERSLSHRDLKSSNILVNLGPTNPNQVLSVIDLVGVRLHYPVPLGRRIQNLARLNVSLAAAPGRSRTEALRFLRCYLPWGLSPRSNWKAIWRSVERASAAKQMQNDRRGRPIS